MVTIKHTIDEAIAAIEAFREGVDDRANREFEIALMNLENAKMRATRGIAMRAGLFDEIDLQTPEGLDQAMKRAAVLAGIPVDDDVDPREHVAADGDHAG
ncbi:hypothetical protein [Patulibacter sp. SYSU D01012]|uniref:hypothetical protein n=1 Tax=Patulibacter sp. SYSU D01012 TaxID=2817381 RepID=UPI001B305F94|nr:hypothetical protein [Patulibacter sp. SYSU D01012]